MSALRTRWTAWSAKYAALSRRERALVAAAIIGGGGFVMFDFAVDRFLVRARAATRAETAARAETAQLELRLAQLTTQNADPDAENRKRLAQARGELAAVSQRLARFEAEMVPPARMRAFLESLLAKNRSLELLGLRTLPVTEIGAPAKPAAAGADGSATAARDNKAATGEGIYQHGVEIRLAGSYNDLLNYLAELERMPQRMMWHSVSISVDKHPRSIMVLRIHTLSLDRNWLVV